MMIRFTLLPLALICALAIACSDDDGAGNGGPTEAPGIDQPIGGITRLPGGTAIPSDLRTLASLGCADETLTLVTERETLTAAMPCDRMLPESITARFVGKEVAIRYDDDRLIVESTTEGTMEFPSDRPAVTGTQ